MLETLTKYDAPYQDDTRPINVPVGPDELDRFILELLDHLKESRSYWGGHHASMKQDRELYRPKQTRANKPYPTACELAPPMLVYTQQNLVARSKRALFSTEPQWNLTGTSAMDSQFAEMVESLLQRQAGPSYMNLMVNCLPTLNGAYQDGVHLVYLRWRQDLRERRRYAMVQRPLIDPYSGMPMLDMMGMPLTSPPQVEVVSEQHAAYDNLEVVPLDKEQVDIWPPTARSIEQAHGVAFTQVLSGNQLQDNVLRGHFDPMAVMKLQQWQGDAYEATSEHQVRQMSATASPTNMRDFTSRPYKITEGYWLYSPRPGQVPARIYLFTIHEETRTVLRFQPNPWWHGEIPMIEWAPLPGKTGILGKSLPDLLGDIQQAITVLMRLLIDDLAYKVAPPVVTRRGMLSPTEMQVFKRGLSPRSIWEINGDPSSIQAMQRETGELPNIGLQFLEMLRQFGARATSMDDINLGRKQPGSATATEIQGMLAEGDVMFAEMVDNLANGHAKLGRLMFLSDLQMCAHPSVRRMWEEANGADPSGMLCLQALSGNYDLVSGGSALSANQALRRAQAQELYGVLMQNPLVANNMLRIYATTQMLVSEYNQRYPERLIGTEQDAMMLQQQMMMVQQLAAQQAAQPGGQQQPASRQRQ
jgi:hypothetical protein